MAAHLEEQFHMLVTDMEDQSLIVILLTSELYTYAIDNEIQGSDPSIFCVAHFFSQMRQDSSYFSRVRYPCLKP